MAQTLYDNFGVKVDHFIQVDFCAFKKIVDAVGGVSVPFTYPMRDTNTGLNITEPGCYTFSGDEALAYVRSRGTCSTRTPTGSGSPTAPPTSAASPASRTSSGGCCRRPAQGPVQPGRRRVA